MAEPITHAKVTTTDRLPDGTGEKVTTESYYDELAHRQVEIEKKVYTSKKAVLTELIEASTLLSEGSPKVTITLEIDRQEFVKVTKRWTVSKEHYKRR